MCRGTDCQVTLDKRDWIGTSGSSKRVKNPNNAILGYRADHKDQSLNRDNSELEVSSGNLVLSKTPTPTPSDRPYPVTGCTVDPGLTCVPATHLPSVSRELRRTGRRTRVT